MSLAKNIYYTACSALPVSLLKQMARPSVLLPYHHTVSDEALHHIAHLYSYKNIRQFTADLEILLKHFKPVTPADIAERMQNGVPPEPNTFLLTFDDGFKEAYTVIAPILKQKGIPAIFFINPAFIDNKELFFRSKTSLLIYELKKQKNKTGILDLFNTALGVSNADINKIIYTFRSSKEFTSQVLDQLAEDLGVSFAEYLQKETPFLTTEQVKELSAQGFTIGAHSIDHPYYPHITEAEQLQQTTASCEQVRSNFGADIKYFSFPYSDALLSQQLFDKLKKSDINVYFGIQNQKEELHNKMLHRFNAERPELSLDKQLKGLLAMIALRKATGKNKVIRN